LQIALPDADDNINVSSIWPAGVYSLSLIVQRPSLPAWTTNRIAFTLSPTVTSIIPFASPPGPVANSPFELQMRCIPQVRPEQRVALLLGDREYQPVDLDTPEDPAAETTLTFSIDGVPAGNYIVRLRVDGIDSIPIDFSAATPEFDSNQMVTVSP
jgi:hypothetical protein